VPQAGPGSDKIVIRINDEPVTEMELTEAFRQVPEDVQRQFGGSPLSPAFAEQYIKLKLLAGEGEKLGVEKDPHIKAQLNASQTNVLAGAALQKFAQPPTDQAVQAYYKEHRKEFESVELSHIVIGYQGSMMPPRDGAKPPDEATARKKALQLYQKVKSGTDFAQVARDSSDDPSSAPNGGKLGPFSKGMLPPEIEPQVLSLAPGEVSQPLPSRYGIHLFKAGPRGVQPLERVRPMLAQKLQQKAVFDRVETLRKAAKVDFDAKVFPDAKTWGKSQAPKAPPS
jgi:hypothetical protein